MPLGPDGLLLETEGETTPLSDRYLCCVAVRDLQVLIPQLPMLAGIVLEAAGE